MADGRWRIIGDGSRLGTGPPVAPTPSSRSSTASSPTVRTPRASQHLAQCPDARRRSSRSARPAPALRTAGGPACRRRCCPSLRAIPQDADLPAPPPGLAVTATARWSRCWRAPSAQRRRRPRSAVRRAPMSHAPQPSVRGPGRHGGAASRLGTGVAVSGLALGALAFGARRREVPPARSARPPSAACRRTGARRHRAGPSGVLDARLQLGRPAPVLRRAHPGPGPRRSAGPATRTSPPLRHAGGVRSAQSGVAPRDERAQHPCRASSTERQPAPSAPATTAPSRSRSSRRRAAPARAAPAGAARGRRRGRGGVRPPGRGRRRVRRAAQRRRAHRHPHHAHRAAARRAGQRVRPARRGCRRAAAPATSTAAGGTAPEAAVLGSPTPSAIRGATPTARSRSARRRPTPEARGRRLRGEGARLSLREVLFGRRVQPRALAVLGAGRAAGRRGGRSGRPDDGRRRRPASPTRTRRSPRPCRARSARRARWPTSPPARCPPWSPSRSGWARRAAPAPGVVIDPSGYVLTNNHVVAPAAEVAGAQIEAIFHDGTRSRGPDRRARPEDRPGRASRWRSPTRWWPASGRRPASPSATG